MPMREAFSHCEQIVREHDKDRFLASLFAPPDRRQMLFALYAFDIETTRIAVIARQPLAGEIRLQWWREALAGDRAEEARASPVAAAMGAALMGRRHLIDSLDAMLEARRADLYDEPVRSLVDLEKYAEAVIAPVIEVAMRLLSEAIGAVAQQFAAHAGKALLLERVACGADVGMMHRIAAHQKEITASGLRSHVAGHLEQARLMLPYMPNETWPAFLPLALIPLRWEKLDIPRNEPQVDAPQWRRQWALWRAARRRRF